MLGISEDFLRRIIYMAEGDVFNFLNNPPKDALDIQIRSVLGLTQLDEYAAALKASEKELKSRLKNLQELESDQDRLEIHSIADLENKLQGSTAARDQFLTQLENIGREMSGFEKSANALRSFRSTLDRVEQFTKANPDVWLDAENSTVPEYFDGLKEEAHMVENHHAEIRLALARLDGQEEAYKKVLAMLDPFEESDETIPCPVCRKPLTKTERKTVIDEIKNDIQKIYTEHVAQNQVKEQAAQKISLLKERAEKIQPLRDLLVHAEIPGIHPSQTLSTIIQSMSQVGTSQQNQMQEELAKQREVIKQRMRELDSYMAEYQAVKNRLGDFGFNSPEELKNELVQIEIRMLSLRAASQAIEGTLENQQNTEMKTIYEQIADLWSSFRGDENWEMEYSAGYPVMTKGDDQLRLDLRQLSGGEKTALLIQLHTIMAHHFSRSDFLMIDEPLEHLDPVNRRSLIKFLVDAYRHNIFSQAIIATFEESLIRKYQTADGVNIVLI